MPGARWEGLGGHIVYGTFEQSLATRKRATPPTSPRTRDGQDRTDADQVDQPGVAGSDQRVELAGELVDFTVEFA